MPDNYQSDHGFKTDSTSVSVLQRKIHIDVFGKKDSEIGFGPLSFHARIIRSRGFFFQESHEQNCLKTAALIFFSLLQIQSYKCFLSYFCASPSTL